VVAQNPSETPSGSNGLADAVAERFEAASRRLAGERHTAVDALVTQWLEAHEHDLAALVRPHIEPHLANVEYPDNVRELFAVLARPEHQTQFFTALFAIQGIINAFVMAALQPYVTDTAQKAWSADTTLALSPDQAADAVLKGWKDRDWAYREAANSGIDSARFDVLYDLAGEPPGIMQMLDLWRRHLISEADLHHAVLESRVRDEWFDAIKLMATVAPSTAQVIAGYVEGHLDESAARAKWSEAGGRDEDFEWEYETAGRPPGMEQMLHLLNRGIVDESTVVQAIRESDIKNKYVPDLLALRRYLPPPRSVVAMVRQGAITDDQARTYLRDAGVADVDIEAFITSAHHTKASTHREASAGLIKTAYVDRVLTRDAAMSALSTAGYSPSAAKLMLDVADVDLEVRERRALITHAHSLYTRWRLTRGDASIALDTAGVPSSDRDALLGLWDFERRENQHVLTKTEVLGAYRRGVRDEQWVNARLTMLGYAEGDLDAIRAEAFPPPRGGAPARP
jgi:hypothetical protein